MNIILPNIFRLPKKCKYSNSGCDYEEMPSKIEALNDHETECPHRNVKCTDIKCSQNVSLSKLLLHLKTHEYEPQEISGGFENSSFVFKPRNLQSKNWASWASAHFTLNGGKEFFCEAVRSPSPTGHFFLWVYMIGTPKEEEHFTYTITLYDANKVIFNVGSIGLIITYY